jgi:hypothetical protein
MHRSGFARRLIALRAQDLSPRQIALAIGAATAFILKNADNTGFDAVIGATLIGEIMIAVSRM